MFVKLATVSDFNSFWLDARDVFVGVSESDLDKIHDSIFQLVYIMCDSYGEDRNPEVEGGNIIIFFDRHADLQREQMLEHYHLNEEGYEIRDMLTEEAADGYVWVSDIYIGTNYNTVMVYRRSV